MVLCRWCDGLNMSSKWKYWNLIPNVMVFGGKAFGRWLDHKDGTLMHGISAPLIDLRELPCPSSLWRRSERWPSVNQEAGTHQHWICQHLHLGLKLPELWEINLFYISHTVYGIFAIIAWTDQDRWYAGKNKNCRNRKQIRPWSWRWVEDLVGGGVNVLYLDYGGS